MYLHETNNLNKNIDEMTEKIDLMREARYLPKDAVRNLVKDYAKDIPENEPIYPSDIAYKYDLDPDVVEGVMDELLEEGFFK